MDEKIRIYNENPLSKANLISKVYICWITPLISLGRRKALTEDDLYSPIPEHKSEYLTDQLENEWNKELKKKKPSLAKALFRIYYKRILLISLIPLLRVILPLLITHLIQYFDGKIDLYTALIYGSSICLITLVNNVIHHPYFYKSFIYAMEAKIAISGLLYRKTLKIQSNKNEYGNVLNLVSNDVPRIEASIIFISYAFIAQIVTVVIIAIMLKMLNHTIIAGLTILVVLISAQVILGRVLNHYRRKTSKITDERISLTTEILNGMKIIKMYCWEQPFRKLIEVLRKKELKSQAMVFLISGIYAAVELDVPPIVTYASVAMFVLTISSHLSPAYLVFIMAYFAKICSLVGFFLIKEISSLITARVSVIRIEEYLLQPEYETFAISKSKDLNSTVEVSDLCASWNDKDAFALNNISFKIKSNELFAIIGQTGSGKSSILMALLDEMKNRNGDIKINGSMFYVSQEPWIFSGTVRQNILFGKEYKKEKFNKIIEVCALSKDLKMLSNGESTIIGDKGVNLSGGQKARISLARALYNDPDIYLFDDPLSAVDANVGKFLFDKCINDYLKSKIRILVTHQVHHLTNANNILILNKGAVQAQGTYDELLSQTSINLSILLTSLEDNNNNNNNNDKSGELNDSKISRWKSESSIYSSQMRLNGSFKHLNEMEMANQNNNSNESDEYDEKRETGKINFRVISGIFKFGIILPIFVFLMFTITQILLNASDYWLTFWADAEEDAFDKNQKDFEAYKVCLDLSNGTLTPCQNITTVNVTDAYIPFEKRQFYFHIASSIIVTYTASFVLRTTFFFAFCLLTSKFLHSKMLDCVMHKKIRFFDINPIGRIINRFSKDISNIDDLLPQAVFDFLQVSLQVFGAIIIAMYVNYWIIVPFIPIVLVFLYLRNFYTSSSRELKRLDALCRSPIFIHINNTLNGLITIRSCRSQSMIRKEYDVHADYHTQAYFAYLSATRWFGIRLDTITMVFTITFIYGCIIAKNYLPLTPGEVGLILVYITHLLGLFQWCVRQSTEVENMATSIERIAEYSDKKEEILHEGLKKPPPNWPQNGEIVFDNVSFSYDKHLPNVLKNITVKINPKEKIGVVGRTGAGKSSIFQALFRMAEVSGSIKIDGIDTKEISLHDLRNNISIIPQEPTLFYGTLRYNLDPFSKYSDQELWDALEAVQLKEPVKLLDGKLDSNIEKAGSNFSVGQKQLFCLARAILRKTKILIIDEATANVDYKTDHLVQQAIRSCFKDCTVITIAHRLKTIIDSDKIMCLSNGELVNYGVPYDLFQNRSSLLYELVQKLGKDEFDRLFEIAKAHAINFPLNESDYEFKDKVIDDDDENDVFNESLCPNESNTIELKNLLP